MRRGRFASTAARRGWFRASAAPLAAVLLDGGRLHVPDEEYADFLALYAECIEEGEWLYVVERPSRYIRFYVDLDVEVDDAAAADLDAVVRCVATSGPDGARHAVVLRAAPKAVDGGVKLGVHIMWPETRVSVEEAETARARILARLEEQAPFVPRNAWSEALDASVYRQGGLRMVGSRKTRPCVDDPRRRVDAGRPYEVDTVLRCEDGAVDAEWVRTFAHNAVLRCRMCSIRTADRATDPPLPSAPSSSSRPARKRCADDPPFARLVLGEVDARHARLVVAAHDGRTLRLEGEGSRYCPNVGREHRQSTLYCTVDARGVHMRCHCRKGTCPRFVAQWPLSAYGARVLGVRTSGEVRGLPHGFV